MTFTRCLSAVALCSIFMTLTGETHAACKVESTSDPLTDATVSVASCPADEHDSDSPPMLMLRCSHQIGGTVPTAEMFIGWGEFLHTEKAEVGARIGDTPHVLRDWSTSTDYQSVFLPGGSSAAIACARAIRGNRFVSRVVPHGGNPRTAIWKSVSSTAVDEAMTACYPPEDEYVGPCPLVPLPKEIDPDSATALESTHHHTEVASGEYTVRFVTRSTEATLECFDGREKVEFINFTSQVFTGRVTCRITADGTAGIIQLDHQQDVFCRKSGDSLSCQ